MFSPMHFKPVLLGAVFLYVEVLLGMRIFVFPLNSASLCEMDVSVTVEGCLVASFRVGTLFMFAK
jgi:hypothetical protein